jgi:predicted negative regulator of RcsB-dependent stress response
MYASELRTCAVGAVVAVLLGAGVGVGWHYFSDSASGRAVAAGRTIHCERNYPRAVLRLQTEGISSAVPK